MHPMDRISTPPLATAMSASTSPRWMPYLFEEYAKKATPGPLLFAFVLALDLVPSVGLVSAGLSLGEGERSAMVDLVRRLRQHVVGIAFLAVIVAPVIETLFLWAIVAGTRKVLGNADVAIVLGAAVLSWLHAPTGVFMALGLGWPFLVCGTVLMSCRIPSRAARFFFVCAVHSAHNAIAILSIIALIQR